METTKRIKKVKLEGGKIRIEYLVPSKGEGGKSDWDELSLLCATPAKPSFHDAMQALAEYVAEIVELPKQWAQTVEVKGVSYSYGGENEVMGASITALKTLDNCHSPFVVNTPHKPSEPYSDGGDDSTCLTANCTYALEDLQREAIAYLNGDRAQLSMDFEDDDEEADHSASDAIKNATVTISTATDSVTLGADEMAAAGKKSSRTRLVGPKGAISPKLVKDGGVKAVEDAIKKELKRK